MSDDLTYPGGLAALTERFEQRRDPFEFGTETLPGLDVDLLPLSEQIVSASATQTIEGASNTSWTRKRIQIAREFVGLSHLSFLNAQLIANLRAIRRKARK